MEKEIKLYDIVTVKEDHVFNESHGTMHCKKGMLGRVIDINETPITKRKYYTVEFFDTSEIPDPVFFFSKDELVLVQTEDEETADYLKNHPEDINDEWLKTNHVDINKIKAIWDREKK